MANESPELMVRLLDHLDHGRRSCKKQPESVDAPCRSSNTVKKSVIDGGSVAAMLRYDPLSASDIHPLEWEIMYPRFVDEGLIDPPDHARE
jgi:hypothetical protein